MALRVAAFAVLLGLAAIARAGDLPRREDLGDLVVLHLAGSYEEMGRQQAELMEPELRAVYEYQRAAYARGLPALGPGGRLIDAAIPLWSAIGPLYEESGFHDEIRGIAGGLGVAPREVLRALLALSGGSTVFAATRGATADGAALLGRSVDWDDAFGRRRPVVAHCQPQNGDLAYVAAGWPLVGLPTVGVNEAGFALSYNFFVSEPRIGVWLPQWPHRRALQRARSVAEGIRIFEETRLLGISTFMVMADAGGDIAMVECIPERCEVFRPEGDWFAQANHARTRAMIPFDRYRSPDSFARLAGMEAAVRPHLGRLAAPVAARILRDRSAGPWPNASHVANLYVLNAAVVHPASRTLWHATSMQPHAPFGSYVPFSPAGDTSEASTLAADPWLASDAARREAAAVAEARRGIERFDASEFAAAAAIWEGLASATPPALDPVRIAWGLALARWHEGDLAAAFEVLAATEDAAGRFDARAHGLVARARLADLLGRREEALRLYRLAAVHLDAGPEFDVFGGLRAQIEAGIAAPAVDRRPPELDFLLAIPR
jgi:hypothetical protein